MDALSIAADGADALVAPLIVFAIAIWIALIWWTHTDARRRLREQKLIRGATALAVIPFLGPVVYMILRPPEYLADAYEREISVASSEKIIEVLSELQRTQREIHASVKHLEQALHASRRRAAQRQPGEPAQSAAAPPPAPPAGERR